MKRLLGLRAFIGCLAALLIVPLGSAETDDLPAEVQFVLPVQESDVVFQLIGLWPFGVRGGDHPEGHPGIDFEAPEGTSVLAAADGSVGFVGTAGHYDYHTVSIGHASRNALFDTEYTGALKNIRVKKGDTVRAGQVLAQYALSGHERTKQEVGSLHFGIRKKALHAAGAPSTEGKPVCPADFLAPDALSALKRLFAKSKYSERAQFPLLCNPCPPSGCR